MNGGPDLDRVADVWVRVALRLAEHDEGTKEGGSDANPGLLSGLD